MELLPATDPDTRRRCRAWRRFAIRMCGGSPGRTAALILLLAPYGSNAVQAAGGQDGPAMDLRALDSRALRLAIEDLSATFGTRYPRGGEFLAALDALEARRERLGRDAANSGERVRFADDWDRLKREALLANPLLDFDRLLVIRRGARNLGLPTNWESNSSIAAGGYDNELCILSPVGHESGLKTLFRPEQGRFIGDVDLHWNADRMLFSMPGDNGRWQVFEMRADGTGLRQVPLIHQPDVDNYDACYLPDGGIMFSSTAAFSGVPCVRGSAHVSNLYRLDAAGRIRRLTFDQDHNWCPTVMNDGRVMYLRWEYADIPHYVSRILFRMNPDGTNQAELYGSNSYWPNSMFYARPIPGDPSRFVAVVSGHHDTRRMGELVLFDPARGRFEANGVVQRIPGRGQPVKPVIRDRLVSDSWPKFLHPWPLSARYFIVSCQPSPTANWGIYLVDTFDNLQLIKEIPGQALLEPIPLRKTPVPAAIPDKVNLESKEATVSITDIYAGPGLAGVPRGSVKRLRLFTYQFAYQGMGGQVDRVGLDGPWDVKRILGTVPVEPDGSACFKVPANTPISIQPLDQDGRALQLMRSWMTAMPGEFVSCAGCHEQQNAGQPVRKAAAPKRPPSELVPWYGPPRGFSFRREVQPVLDRYCVACHDGTRAVPDLTDRPDVHTTGRDGAYNENSRFPPSYYELRYHVRGPGIESDMNLLNPGEYHAGTTRLVRMLDKGHHGVKLDGEAWDRLITWIDLNTPAHGTWTEFCGDARVRRQRERRIEMNRLYANLSEDPEDPVPPVLWGGRPVGREPVAPLAPKPAEPPVARVAPVDGPARSIDLGNGIKLDLVYLAPGRFMMGSDSGFVDEQPRREVVVDRGFWMGRFEITNEQYELFDPAHDSHLEDVDFLQFEVETRGYPLNGPRQPVCRVSWRRAMEFCAWLSAKTGLRFSLPTEAQWEFACRAGGASAMNYGTTRDDFSRHANLADDAFRVVDTFSWGLPSGAIPPWRPAIGGIKDGHRVSAPAGSFAPNAWGLHDMHGNVAEWTRDTYVPRGRAVDAAAERSLKSVRGGSWYDRPQEATSSYRGVYPDWMRVYDVGFRVMCE